MDLDNFCKILTIKLVILKRNNTILHKPFS